MRRGIVGVVLGLAVACADPFRVREFDCPALVEAYTTGCGGHLGVSVDTAACEALRDGQNGEFAPTVCGRGEAQTQTSYGAT
jgi:hypothetical protein